MLFPLSQSYQKITTKSITISNIIKSYCPEKSYLLTQKQLPAQIAEMCHKILNFPRKLQWTSSLQSLQKIYHQSLVNIDKFSHLDLKGSEQLTKFNDTLEQIHSDFSTSSEILCNGLLEYRDECGLKYYVSNLIDDFYSQNIGIKLLIDSHLNTVSWRERNDDIIDCRCDVVKIMKKSFEDARSLCYSFYKVNVDLCCPNIEGRFLVTSVPSHLYLIGFELFKNAIRATVENKGSSVVELRILEGIDDLTIKISDNGGGISHSKVEEIFQYAYSTAPNPLHSFTFDTLIAGYGHGLPLSNLHARYFGGDLKFVSIQGYGTDVYVYLNKKLNYNIEILPSYKPENESSYYKLN